MEISKPTTEIPPSVDRCYKRGCPAMQQIVHEAWLQGGVIYDGGYFAQRLNGSLEGFSRGGLEFRSCPGLDRSFGMVICEVVGIYDPSIVANRPARIF